LGGGWWKNSKRRPIEGGGACLCRRDTKAVHIEREHLGGRGERGEVTGAVLSKDEHGQTTFRQTEGRLNGTRAGNSERRQRGGVAI